eukprot:GHUV01004560.1.p1 GENE.GHUV01004560.1~~GHUV01004560.1.p1  ORF type:complete len:225 (+),score=64.82 GHUV01004560.1:496-1170(+)
MSSATNKPILTYFPVPARAEIARLAFTVGKVDFEDKRINPAEWPNLKSSMPFGQLPTLQIGDNTYAESNAIDRYAGKVAGLIPEDPELALVADQAYFFVVQDIHNGLIAPINRIKDPEEQTKARQELVAIGGPLRDRLQQLTNIVANKRGKFLTGDKLSLGDLAIFNTLSGLRSGLWKGIRTDILDSYPHLKAFRHAVATVPEIAAYYAQATDDTRKNGYTPDQ